MVLCLLFVWYMDKDALQKHDAYIFKQAKGILLILQAGHVSGLTIRTLNIAAALSSKTPISEQTKNLTKENNKLHSYFL